MPDDRTWIQFVSRVNALTQDREVVWVQKAAPEELRKGQRVESIYSATVKGRGLRLYQRVVEGLMDALKSGPNGGVILEILNEDGSVATVVPSMPGLEDLLSSVRFQVSGIDEFVKSVIYEPI